MSRHMKVAAAQLGPIHLADSRQRVVSRLIELLREAHGYGARLVVFPELALTTFFPRYWMEDQAEVDAFFEQEMPSAATAPLFDAAKELGMGFYLGYAEMARENGAAGDPAIRGIQYDSRAVSAGRPTDILTSLAITLPPPPGT